MNKKLFFLVAIIFLLIYVSATKTNATMTCLDELEYQGDDIIARCYEFKFTQYNTTRPEIKVRFPGDVEVKSYKLKRIANLGEGLDINDTTEFFQPFDNYPRYELQRRQEGGANIFTSKSPLADGIYAFKIDAFNAPRVLLDIVVFFEINASQFDIWIHSPAHHDVVKPQFAASRTQINNLSIETENPVEGCTFLRAYETSNLSVQDLYYFFADSFQPVTDTILTTQNFNFATGFIAPNSDHNFNIFHVVCKEKALPGTPSRYAYKRLYYVHLPNPPTITSQANPSIVVDFQRPESILNITTSQTTACTIKFPTIPENEGRNPSFKFTENYLFDKIDYYKLNTIDTLFFFPRPTPYEFYANITCTNLANLSSTITQRIDVDFAETANFQFITPQNYVNTKSINISGGYTSPNVYCYARFNEENTRHELTYSHQLTTGRYLYQKTVTNNNLQEGPNTVHVNCEGMQTNQYSSRTFTIDTVPPTNMNLTVQPYTCSLTRIQATMSAQDENGIKEFEYELIYLGNKEGDFNREGKTGGALTLPFTQAQGLLLENESFRLRARAIDRAENPSNWVEKTVKLTSPDWPDCDSTPPVIYIDALFNDVFENWQINVSCYDAQSGCKDTFLWATNTNTSAECNPTTTERLSNSLTINTPGLFCAQVSDLNDNTASKTIVLNPDGSVTEPGEDCEGKCGGDCPLCEDGEGPCEQDSDCKTNYCLDGICRIAPCNDGIQNGLETDIDCGGPHCDACPIGAQCLEDKDCVDGNCVDGFCEEPSCFNRKQDGLETDIDCGGPDCDPCGLGQGCLIDEDCAEGECRFGVCQIPSAPGPGPGPGEPPIEPPIEPVIDEKKSSLLGLIFLIIGILSMIAGGVLLYLEDEKKKKMPPETDDIRLKQQLNMGKTGFPEVSNINNKVGQDIKTLSPEKKEQRKKAWENSVKAKDKKRKDLLNEFDDDLLKVGPLSTDKQKGAEITKNKEEKIKTQTNTDQDTQDINEPEIKQAITDETKITDKENINDIKPETKSEEEKAKEEKEDEDFFKKLEEITKDNKKPETKKVIKKKKVKK